ncbi:MULTISPECIES: sugar phosphate nucleotidyltransferase [unclassified Streptomyces]|uniref:sugar phosphate nucleotidyltransferase n=1 Tax=unclassified Streptomyces TaxID=2593676 RepID=UPI001BE7EF29|nr:MULTISPECIES: NDP-sugar synthase [unclassified Streptomyces]MBT2405520.1 NDP-sugar synthase [Streptomyces sp. ISL-21]MBT2454438.1 NDP-sugar synthase [Streptomyces sp. ISL-86]MBT2607801.1 NDP-sugar synthase [Streptomyces sp. ISL-87]
MSTDRETVGIILAGGRGERAKPITLESADYIRSKALIPFVGRRLIEWVLEACREQGIRRFYVVTHGLENRNQIKLLLGYGERYGVEIRYSRSRFDRYNVGSAGATLHNLEQWDLQGQALVLPVDSLFDFDLKALTATHAERGALVTVAAVERTADEIAAKYGVMRTGRDGLVQGFVEKPDAGELRELFPLTAGDARATLPTNAGMYLVDCGRLRLLARDPELFRQSHQRLDWGGDLLPWLVGRGHPVAAHAIGRLGDLGNVPDYLDTVQLVLNGAYEQMNRLMADPDEDAPVRRWIHASSLQTKDDVTGTTLAQKIEEGSVLIGPGVRIGRDVEIGSGVRLEHADIGDGAEVREGSTLVRSTVGESAVIGAYAEVSDSYVGPMAEVHSERDRPARLEDHAAIGDGAVLSPGTRFSGICVYPRLRVPALTGVPARTELRNSDDILRWA